VKPESVCGEVQAELSALLDGEIDAPTAAAVRRHVEGCPHCSRQEANLRAVRSALRVVPAGSVPDLTEPIMARVADSTALHRRRARRWHYAKTGLVAAAATIALLFGATAPWLDQPADLAGADQIVSRVKNAARSLTSYRASYEITERGWHDDVAQRTFVADVWFGAPERYRLDLRDLTPYPEADRWPRNDVEIVSAPGRWWIHEPFSCPVEALPDCAVAAEDSVRSIVGRAPFDGATALPTDLILPLETLAGAGGFEVNGLQSIAGRNAYRIDLAYRQARPLIAAVQAGGSWRPFHPLDQVRLWIDEHTWFPLRFDVVAGSSAEREQWALGMAVDDDPGEVLLSVRARSFSTPAQLRPELFSVPRSGTVSRGGFAAGPASLFAAPGAPDFVAGLSAYRAGTANGASVLTYSDGMTWLKVVIDDPASKRARAAGSDPSLADEVRLTADSFGYYRPSDSTLRRQIDVFGRGAHLHLESNLDRESLIRVAASAGVTGRRVGAGSLAAPGLLVRRVGPSELNALSWALSPSSLPAGYDPGEPSAALVYGRGTNDTVVLYYRNPEAEFDGSGIRVTQTRSMLPPSSEKFVGVEVNGEPARWSPERGELEWMDGETYRAVRAPSFDLSVVIEVAEGLR
jgi:Putative zinc-finger